MSDMPKGLRTVAGYRWVLLINAVLLSVVALLLGWLELEYHNAPVLRSFALGAAMVLWVAWILLCCTVCAVRVITKYLSRVKVQIIEAICERRLEVLADLMEEGNVRQIHDKRR